MALFKRTPKDQTIAELERYYSQYGTRSGKAWLVALASLFTTVVVLVGLFFGGRWLYRAVSEDDAQVATTQTEPDAQSPASTESTDDTDDEVTVEQGTVSNEAASTTESNADRVAAATNVAPTTSATSAPLPQTGPELSLLVATVLFTLIAGYAYSIKNQRR